MSSTMPNSDFVAPSSSGSTDFTSVRMSLGESGGASGLADSVLLDDPPVIVGTACHLPGGIRSPSNLWDFLVAKKSAQGPVPVERYNIDGFYNKVSRSGTTNVPGGYFIDEDVRAFDNAFFGINNLEATYMDPQQRKLLEVVYEALCSAGTTMEGVSRSSTGVFVANFSVDYQPMQTRDPDYLHRYVATGSGATIMSNRISHVFNLHGPSNTIDTACSSSIYALHQALNALKTKDCEGVIVASANLIMSPELHIGAAKSGVLSPTGTCHTFDSSADGYGRAEAVNAVYIKPLSAALRDGNPIRAVVRGSAVNASGKTSGISLPSGAQQQAVMRKAYDNAGLDFAGTDYVECHGTGTPVGDPIEVEAVGGVFSPSGAPREGPPLLIGSVKTNVGHSEGASGLTSILKVIQSFENGLIAPSRGITQLNPKLVLTERNLKIAQELEEWPRALRRASINSFGYGGANAHIILESAESYLGQECQTKYDPELKDGSTKPSETDKQSLLVLPVSASSATSLDAAVQQTLQTMAKVADEETLRNIAHTLSYGRDHFRHRSVVLEKLDKGGAASSILPNENTAMRARTAKPLPLGFVFTGQGAQYAGMAKELLLESQRFRGVIRELDGVLRGLAPSQAPDWTLEQTLLDDPSTSRINEVTRSQPICTAVQIGLVELLRDWGVTPQAVIGHSSGEIAAAYAAGILTASQAILVAYFRGFAVGQLKSKGAMMAAGLTPDAARLLLQSKELDSQVRVACVNSPESVTFSGTPEGIEELIQELQQGNKFARKLETGGRAYHSHMMAEIGKLYEDLLSPFFGEEQPDLSGAHAKMYSSVADYTDEGERLCHVDGQTYMPAYWRKNLEQPVQFSGGLSSLLADEKGGIHLIEIGPHAALKGPIKQIRTSLKLDETLVPYSASLTRQHDADASMKTLAGIIFTHGHETLNWDAVNGQPRSRTHTHHGLEPYPWDYSAGLLWSEPRASMEMRNRKHVRHELLGTAALTGNGIDFSWRNLLRLSEVPWLKDHRVEDTIVFPATGYLAMAVEAVSQVTGAKDKPATELSFEFRNVSISTALNVPDEERDIFSPKDLELHTTMSARKMSNANASADWHDFSVSSWLAGRSAMHCAGSVRITRPRRAGEAAAAAAAAGADDEGIRVRKTESFDTWAQTDKWYNKWASEGLCFGPSFRSVTELRTDSSQVRREMIGVTSFEPGFTRRDAATTSVYPVHPITIDAALQTAILSSTAGNVTALKAWLPVFIAECRLQSPRPAGVAVDEGGEYRGEVHGRSEETGIFSRSIEGTLRDAHGDPVVDFSGLRTSLYTGKTTTVAAAAVVTQTKDSNGVERDPAHLFAQRQPTLRVQWKPDILRLSPGSGSEAGLCRYIKSFVDCQHDDLRDDESLAIIAALLDLAGHKNPRSRILEIDGDALGYKAEQWQSVLGKETAFPRVRSWLSGKLSEDGALSLHDDAGEESFDVVLVPRHATSKLIWGQATGRIVELLSDTGVIVTRRSDASVAQLEAHGFGVLHAGKEVLLAVRKPQTRSLAGRRAVIVRADTASPAVTAFAEALVAILEDRTGVSSASIISLGELDGTQISEETICVSLMEIEREFLATISPTDTDRLRLMTEKAKDVLWITGANMLGAAPEPDLTLSNGLSRALMLEQPMLRFSVLDVGLPVHLDAAVGSELALKALTAAHDKDDTEFIERDGLLHISRYMPDLDVNDLFRRRLGLDGGGQMMTKTLAEACPATLAIGRVGAMDTLHFKQTSEPDPERPERPKTNTVTPATGTETPPPAGYVDIQVKAVGLNAKDVYAMSGRVDTRDKTTALDFSGVVTAIGGHVTHLRVGDRAVAYAPHRFGTTVRVPAGAVHKMMDTEEYTVMPTLLVVYATALYALNDRARLRKGETVLIHAGSGGLGIAAITLAQQLGAVVYSTAGSQAKRDYLINTLGVPSSHVFSSRDPSFAQAIMRATDGRGVDVVLNSLVGDLMHESWRCLSDFGRFVEVGKRELLDAGKLDMRVFLRNATFTAFDLSELFFAQDPFHRAIWDRLMTETLELYRANEIRPLPTKVFDVSQIAQAYRYFARQDRVGKVVISMENDQARVPFAPATYLSVFDADKVYLLVGCLGGLGRSLSRWMMKRGARHFVFLGRSGADKPSAQQLVSRLKEAGATVTVVRGDVSKATDVTASVSACVATGRRVGGVVQAAMGLHEALFARMSNEAWHTGIQPKWRGTWNIHHALQAQIDKDPSNEPDFFLLTSSVSGTVGTATEANYCSANGFLDAFARWRRSRGQAGVAVGLGMISEVGYLHENPEIEALLLRKGIQPLNEDEFLQVVDLALSSEAGRKPAQAHMLTGLEPAAVRQLSNQGFDVTSHGTLVEARASVLLASLLAEKEAFETSNGGGVTVAVTAAAASWFRKIPAALSAAFAPVADADSVREAILRLIKNRFSNLILMPADQIADSRPLPDFGVDSMIASEFRTWFWAVFKVDVPFLDLMSSQTSLLVLAENVETKLEAAG